MTHKLDHQCRVEMIPHGQLRAESASPTDIAGAGPGHLTQAAVNICFNTYHIGARVTVDCIGCGAADGFGDWTDQDRAAIVAELFKHGYDVQVTISRDLNRPTHLAACGGAGHGCLLTGFVPMLHRAGLSQQHTELLPIDTPRAVLTPARWDIIK